MAGRHHYRRARPAGVPVASLLPAAPPPAPLDRRAWALLLVTAVATGYLASVSGMLWWANIPRVAGWEPRVVMTGSMRPVLEPGDVVLIGPTAVSPGDLPPGRLALVSDPTRDSGSYLHRVVRYDAAGLLVTRGDANATEDHPAVTAERVLGQARLVVPYVGTPAVWLAESRYAPSALAALVTWAALFVVLRYQAIVPRHHARRRGSRPGRGRRADNPPSRSRAGWTRLRAVVRRSPPPRS